MYRLPVSGVKHKVKKHKSLMHIHLRYLDTHFTGKGGGGHPIPISHICYGPALLRRVHRQVATHAQNR